MMGGKLVLGAGSVSAVVKVRCGLVNIRVAIAAELHSAGIRVREGAETILLFDVPFGFALSEYKRARAQGVVMVTDNPCPEYRLELLTREPLALLSGVNTAEIASALRTTPAPPAYPAVPSPLAPAERRTLYLAATGHDNAAIACIRGVKEQTVKNTLHEIYLKLSLNTRLQLTHYFFGHWHLLGHWAPPAHLELPDYLQ